MKRAMKDYTATFRALCPIESEDAIPMYSYERPAWVFWSAFMNGLIAGGYTEEEAIEWLKSKAARWALDKELGDKLKNIAFEFAEKNASAYATKEDCAGWVRQNKGVKR